MGILIEADRAPKEGAYGHHGVTLARGSYNLVTDFVVAAPQVRGVAQGSQVLAGRLCLHPSAATAAVCPQHAAEGYHAPYLSLSIPSSTKLAMFDVCRC